MAASLCWGHAAFIVATIGDSSATEASITCHCAFWIEIKMQIMFERNGLQGNGLGGCRLHSRMYEGEESRPCEFVRLLGNGANRAGNGLISSPDRAIIARWSYYSPIGHCTQLTTVS